MRINMYIEMENMITFYCTYAIIAIFGSMLKDKQKENNQDSNYSDICRCVYTWAFIYSYVLL